jgi:hypothetical protein
MASMSVNAMVVISLGIWVSQRRTLIRTKFYGSWTDRRELKLGYIGDGECVVLVCSLSIEIEIQFCAINAWNGKGRKRQPDVTLGWKDAPIIVVQIAQIAPLVSASKQKKIWSREIM